MRKKLNEIDMNYDSVFNAEIIKYDFYSGKIEATVNMGPNLQPQGEERRPRYNRDQMIEL